MGECAIEQVLEIVCRVRQKVAVRDEQGIWYDVNAAALKVPRIDFEFCQLVTIENASGFEHIRIVGDELGQAIGRAIKLWLEEQGLDKIPPV